jgi:4-hydroxybenzoyl-CoA thioesterase
MARFETTRVLRFGDCDPAGIAYYPRYFDLLNGVVED